MLGFLYIDVEIIFRFNRGTARTDGGSYRHLVRLGYLQTSRSIGKASKMAPPAVLMVGTGEYTTGFVSGAASTSDKKVGVVGLTRKSFVIFEQQPSTQHTRSAQVVAMLSLFMGRAIIACRSTANTMELICGGLTRKVQSSISADEEKYQTCPWQACLVRNSPPSDNICKRTSRKRTMDWTYLSSLSPLTTNPIHNPTRQPSTLCLRARP